MQLGTGPGTEGRPGLRRRPGVAAGAATGVRARLVGLTRSGRSYRSKSSSTFSVTGWDWQAST